MGGGALAFAHKLSTARSFLGHHFRKPHKPVRVEKAFSVRFARYRGETNILMCLRFQGRLKIYLIEPILKKNEITSFLQSLKVLVTSHQLHASNVK